MDLLPESFDGDLIKYKLPMKDLCFIQKHYKNLLLILSKNSLADINQIICGTKTDENIDLHKSMYNLLEECFPSLKEYINKSKVTNVKMGQQNIGKLTIYFLCFSFCSFQISASVQYYNDDENSCECCLTINDEAFYQLNKDLFDFAVKKRKAYIDKINSIACVLGLKENKYIVSLNKFLLNLAFDHFPGIDPLYDFTDFYNLNLFI